IISGGIVRCSRIQHPHRTRFICYCLQPVPVIPIASPFEVEDISLLAVGKQLEPCARETRLGMIEKRVGERTAAIVQVSLEFGPRTRSQRTGSMQGIASKINCSVAPNIEGGMGVSGDAAVVGIEI